MNDCVFCDIVSRNSPSFPIWENDEYMAFLSIFPNTPGTTVVIPKLHYSSYVFDLSENVFMGLVDVARIVSKHLDDAFDDVGRTGMIVEGFGVDHAHVKLYPMHGTVLATWKKIESQHRTFSKSYEGFL